MAALAVWALLAPVAVAASKAAVETRELLSQQEGLRMLAAPDAPTNLNAFNDFNTMSMSLPLMRVSWQPPAGGAPVLGYKVYVQDNLIDTVNAGSWTQTKLTNLVVGTRYKVRQNGTKSTQTTT